MSSSEDEASAPRVHLARPDDDASGEPATPGGDASGEPATSGGGGSGAAGGAGANNCDTPAEPANNSIGARRRPRASPARPRPRPRPLARPPARADACSAAKRDSASALEGGLVAGS